MSTTYSPLPQEAQAGPASGNPAGPTVQPMNHPPGVYFVYPGQGYAPQPPVQGVPPPTFVYGTWVPQSTVPYHYNQYYSDYYCNIMIAITFIVLFIMFIILLVYEVEYDDDTDDFSRRRLFELLPWNK